MYSIVIYLLVIVKIYSNLFSKNLRKFQKKLLFGQTLQSDFLVITSHCGIQALKIQVNVFVTHYNY